MCHTYRDPPRPRNHYAEAYAAILDPQLELPFGDYYPTKPVPAIRLEHGERRVAVCSWGLLPSWWKPKKEGQKPASFQRGTYNAMSETVDVKPTFRSAFKSRRCLLPAASFFEKGHWFNFPDERPFAFAGLWESWHDGIIQSCTLLTTEPNEEVRGVGHHRMPVILSSEAEYARWLDPTITTRAPLEGLMRPLADGALVSVAK